MQRYEIELNAEEKAEEFKSMIFASDRKLFAELFGTTEQKLDGPEVIGDEEVEFPETPEEFRAMVASMKRQGMIPGEE